MVRLTAQPFLSNVHIINAATGMTDLMRLTTTHPLRAKQSLADHYYLQYCYSIERVYVI